MDQAEGLRTLMDRQYERGRSSLLGHEMGQKDRGVGHPRVISVTSGKGGVGKTNVVINLALAFSRLGKKVLILDADLGLANIDVLLGLVPRYTIEHFFERQKSLSEILIEGPGGIRILPASSGVSTLAHLDESQKLYLLEEVDLLAEEVDLFLIDTGAGISSNVLYFNMAAQESIVVVTPEPTSLTDAYALIKVLSKDFEKKHFMVLVNFVSNEEEAKHVFRKINKVVDRFLKSLSIDYLGFIPFDERLPQAVRHQRPVIEAYPAAQSSRRFEEVARTLQSRPSPQLPAGGIQFFWKRFFQAQNHLRLERGVV